MGKIKIDDLIDAFQINPSEGLQVISGEELDADRLDLGSHLVIMHIKGEFTASEVKLKLMEKYPDEHNVTVTSGNNATIKHMSLFEMDQMEKMASEFYLYVHPLELDARTRSFATTQYYMDAIQDGDMWVQEQTHESLMPYLREESEEVAEAIANKDVENLIEELGDVLLQVIYHAGHAEQEGYFNLEDILETLNLKLRRRHPHVFDGYPVETIEDIDAMWQKIKKQEKENNNET
ncbi:MULTISPECIES: MazG nucleotide pyrophosphohydrolase domain-containing protein [unclassified Jeotgalibaca]|uniref:MazG nucleotide pyrophosphohydrolase domain-containing protein n=1 Tax=unclassified Jeotgalibaca TaxID=2621505 RepID=UPI003FD01D76